MALLSEGYHRSLSFYSPGPFREVVFASVLNQAIQLNPGNRPDLVIVFTSMSRQEDLPTDYDGGNPTLLGSARINLCRYLGWVYTERGSGWLAKKDFDKAIHDCDQATQLDPCNYAAYYLRGSAWHFLKQHDKAFKDFDEAIRLDPCNAVAYYLRGSAWYSLKDYDKAFNDFDVAFQLRPKANMDYRQLYLLYNPSGVACVNQGCARFSDRDFEKAIQDFNEAITLDPNDAFAYYKRGSAWYFLKDYDKAFNDFETAIELKPDLRAVIKSLTAKESCFAVLLR